MKYLIYLTLLISTFSMAKVDLGKRIGAADLTVWGFNIYRAELYSDSGKYSAQDNNLALLIRYKVNISRDRLISQTDKQFKQQGISNSKRRAWKTQLQSIWPDIEKKDELIFQKKSGCFYFNAKAIGCLNDSEFTKAFLNIWLGKKSDYPKQRQQLIGAKK